jgi:hypothetical protein
LRRRESEYVTAASVYRTINRDHDRGVATYQVLGERHDIVFAFIPGGSMSNEDHVIGAVPMRRPDHHWDQTAGPREFRFTLHDTVDVSL